MAEISIPSLLSQSNNDWTKQIDSVLEKERAPVQRLETQRDEYQNKHRIWTSIRRQITQLSQDAKILYQFGNPFTEREVQVSDDRILTATSKTGSSLANYDLKIQHLAQPERLVTDTLSKDFVVPDGNYHFKLGDEEVSFHFNEKTLENFVDRLNTDASGMMRAFLVRVRENEHVLGINSLMSGADKSIEFNDAAAEFANRSNMHVIRKATDALVSIDGIVVERDSNTIDDIIPAITLELHKVSEEDVQIQVQPNKESAKRAIVQFVGMYNQTMRDIHILTRNKPEIIDEISYFTEEEREQAHERLGLLIGDASLNRLANQLQSNVRASNLQSRNIPELENIGIQSQAFSQDNPGGNLLGYLDIDEEKLDDALKNNYENVARIFGNDRNNDLIIDGGIAFDVEATIKQYTQSGGIISSRMDRIDGLVSSTNEQIDRYNDKIQDLERDLVQQFTKLEQQIRIMQQGTNSIENLTQGSRR